ncbi:hypothetical protein [Sphingomonas turrisvirgatae]|uniref:PsbP C-terminal domain-containing protein n=1 Tax=Sphingomonas turrisvirgatae TaxID=1888892 RepID=A0A1E3LW26_9SPHN|nr:hypothetical protein [Sphingomonas turrisvirgatae]ODP37010.1 hypothetical protein BFL28_19305 [Sphingomonas turrisvirgatae]
MRKSSLFALGLIPALLLAVTADAHKLRTSGVSVAVADSGVRVTPTRDWNRLDVKPGKKAETWTLDGTQLNDVTFYGGIEPGNPLVKERSKKREPLPKFTAATLVVEVPELLESTYRAYKGLAAFTVESTAPAKFLGQDGVRFTYFFTDDDQLTRKGEARAAIIKGSLYMVTFDAPRLHYFDHSIADFRALADSAKLN